ncbi:MAG: TetR family transcriptional regulator [Chlamydiales bacterium]|jgi:TetR/AcrR family transcriptional repressor of nem operon|nr:TetR family transcriptional regulator [Chlamydiales bacterium]
MSTKQQIFQYATTLLKKRGYYGWSYEDISKKIEIRKASIHYYYPTKENLVQDVLNSYIEHVLIKLNEIISNNLLAYTQKLEGLFELYRYNYTSKDELCLCTILTAELQILPYPLQALLKHFFSSLEKSVVKLLEEGCQVGEFKANLDEEAAARIVLNCLQGLLITGKLLDTAEHTHFDQIKEQMIAFLKA